MSNPFDPYVVTILLDLPKEKREEALALIALVAPPRDILRLRRLVAIVLAAKN